MEGQSATDHSNYQYHQSSQWSRLLRRNTLAAAATASLPPATSPSYQQKQIDILPNLLPQHPSIFQAQLAQYNKLISSGKVRLQPSPLPPVVATQNIQAVSGTRSCSASVDRERNTRDKVRSGHGNKNESNSGNGERTLITPKEKTKTMPSKNKLELYRQLPSRPSAQQNPTIQHSSSVPSTPQQHARQFSFGSREPSPNAAPNHSPRSAYSESNSILPPLRPLPPRSNKCRFETAMAHSRRRMAYSIGTDKLEDAKPGSIKSKLTEDEERQLTGDMRELYDRLLPTPASEAKRQRFVQKLENLLNSEWPGHDIKVHMFGSSGNLLCTDESDGWSIAP